MKKLLALATVAFVYAVLPASAQVDLGPGCVIYSGNWTNAPATACLPVRHGHDAIRICKKKHAH